MSRPFSIRSGVVTDSIDGASIFDREFVAIPDPNISPGTPRFLSQRIQPGDLITADLVNSILARLDALESRPVPTVPPVTVPPVTPPTRPPITRVPTNIDVGVATGLVVGDVTRPGGLTTAIGGLGNLSGIGLTAGETIRREESVTALPGIGREEASRLTNAGIRDIGGVADADPVVLGTTLGVQPTEAARMIGNARGVLGRPR